MSCCKQIIDFSPLSECVNLEILQLNETKITTEQLQKIFSRLKKLQQLELREIQFRDDLLIEISKNKNLHTSLKSIDFKHNNEINDYGLIQLLEKCSTLQEIKLSECDNIGEEGKKKRKRKRMKYNKYSNIIN